MNKEKKDKIANAYWREAKRMIPDDKRIFAKKYFLAGFTTCFTHIEVTEKVTAKRLENIAKKDGRKVFLNNILDNFKYLIKGKSV